jgi:hypothetical protein
MRKPRIAPKITSEFEAHIRKEVAKQTSTHAGMEQFLRALTPDQTWTFDPVENHWTAPDRRNPGHMLIMKLGGSWRSVRIHPEPSERTQ